MNNLTICVPYAPHHSDVVKEAIASVKAQTIPCELIVYSDDDMKGAGYARNRALERVTSFFCAFLDADDVIDPHFAEISMGVFTQYAETGKSDPRYVYTDWHGVDNVVHKAPEPCQAWTESTFHLVTTVLPTHAVRAIGGFDEVMTGVEDADFYVRLRLSGLCGIHVNAPLVTYRAGGRRSIIARASGQEAHAKQYMSNRYGGYNLMGCCGDNAQHPLAPENEPESGDVLAQAQWHGNRRQLGYESGRLYPRTSYPKMLYISPADLNAAPHMWKAVGTPMQASNGVILLPQYAAQSSMMDWKDTVGAIFGGGQAPQPPANPIEYKPHVAGRSKASVVAKAQEWTKVEGSLD